MLDCTLRDGAYLIDKEFGDNTIHGMIEGLVKAKMDFIEIGFFQNEGFGEGKTVYRNSEDAKRFIPDNKNGCQFTVLADYSRFSVENLDACTPDSIDAVRECFFKHERYDAIEACKVIKSKGYKLFIQPVDILGYTDQEILEFLQLVNEVEPYCISIVDTFGSMYQEDLHRIFELINHNLVPTCKMGFHSHNNMQLSNALSQEFVRMSIGKREVVIDGTINGMGRGAGNTPTELVAQYLVSRFNYGYDIDALLDVIDDYMDNIRTRCSWGYTTPYFVAGCYSAHVNNITYLLKKNSIRSKDIRYIMNKIGSKSRKRYDYDLLEQTYLELLQSNTDDTSALKILKNDISARPVLILVPGSSVTKEEKRIHEYIDNNNPVIISVNFLHDNIKSDYIYLSNLKRYNNIKNDSRFKSCKKILPSNMDCEYDKDRDIYISFTSLIKCGWEHLDNSTMMLLRLLDRIGVSEIAIAGFDGYVAGQLNYAKKELDLQTPKDTPMNLNAEIQEMFDDYINTRNHKETPVVFVTESRFNR
jgi:4-hydroxy 2-oxovalerate aldolase